MSRRVTLPADNLLQGISQQVPDKRSLNHAQRQVNLFPSAVHGNMRRPPLQIVRDMAGGGDNAAWHSYQRDPSEGYLVRMGSGSIAVFDKVTGAEVPVNAVSGTGYLVTVGKPYEMLEAMTLADTTFIINRERSVAMLPDLSPFPARQALVYVVQGDYGLTYSVWVGGSSTPAASVTTSKEDVLQTDTAFIAGALATKLQASLSPTDYTITQRGSVIIVGRIDGQPMEITATDGRNNRSIRAVQRSVKNFEELPARAPDGYTVNVRQSAALKDDDYWVKFVADTPSNPESAGVWVETTGPGLTNNLDPSTLPHILVREADGTFTFKRADWAPRKVGDGTSSPRPGIVGQRLQGLFTYQNRLGFLAGSKVVMSRTSDYFNLWNGSARTNLDDDPVNLEATTDKALTLLYAIPFDRKLILFADQAQLVLEGGSVFTPDNAAITLLTSYESDPKIRPAVLGRSVFFGVRRGEGAPVSLLEMVPGETVDRFFVNEITEHVPSLIPPGNYKIAGSARVGVLLLIPQKKSNDHAVAVYNWLDRGQERVVSAWSLLQVTSDNFWMRHAAVDGDTLTAVVTQPSGRDTFLRGNLAPKDPVRAASEVCLDYRATLVVPPGRSVSLPSKVDQRGLFRVIGISADGSLARDITAESVLSTDGASVVVPAGWPTVVTGLAYTTLYEFSPPFAPSFGPRGETVPNTTDRLQLTHLNVALSAAGPITATVRMAYREPWVSIWQAPQGPLPLDGKIPLGSLKLPLGGRNTETTVTLSSDAWTPFVLTSAVWDGKLMKEMR